MYINCTFSLCYHYALYNTHLYAYQYSIWQNKYSLSLIIPYSSIFFSLYWDVDGFRLNHILEEVTAGFGSPIVWQRSSSVHHVMAHTLVTRPPQHGTHFCKHFETNEWDDDHWCHGDFIIRPYKGLVSGALNQKLFENGQ